MHLMEVCFSGWEGGYSRTSSLERCSFERVGCSRKRSQEELGRNSLESRHRRKEEIDIRDHPSLHVWTPDSTECHCSRDTQLLVLLHLAFCWQLLSDFPWRMVCSLFLDLGLDDIDLTSNLRNEWHRPSKKSAILSQNLETSLEKCQQMALPQDAQLCGVMNFFFFKQHIFLLAPCKNLSHSLYLICVSFCDYPSMLEILFLS